MSEFVENLRRTADFMKQASGLDPAWVRQAADEIERLQRRVVVLEMVIREEIDPDLCGCDANRMIAEGIHERPLHHPVGTPPND